ncbi:MAG: hypothetical protein N3A02_07580, partial [Rectinema sp.]|nr:hypothetical protein [Rectinema sp.]
MTHHQNQTSNHNQQHPTGGNHMPSYSYQNSSRKSSPPRASAERAAAQKAAAESAAPTHDEQEHAAARLPDRIPNAQESYASVAAAAANEPERTQPARQQQSAPPQAQAEKTPTAQQLSL